MNNSDKSVNKYTRQHNQKGPLLNSCVKTPPFRKILGSIDYLRMLTQRRNILPRSVTSISKPT